MTRTGRFSRRIGAMLAAWAFAASPLGDIRAFAQAAAPAPKPAPPPAPAPSPAGNAQVSVSAAFPDGRAITSGLVWRVFKDNGQGSKPGLVTKSADSTTAFNLTPGSYIVHASYGFASASKQVSVRPGVNPPQQLTIAAGALSLAGAIGDQPIPAAKTSFSVYVPIGSNSEGRLIVANARRGELIRLPEGNYHVVSTYGDTNSIMRTDLKVEAGKVTEATLNHRAATITLKLVSAPGGEALAGTAFSVLTPGGDVIREAIGAFPQMILAEGDYVVIARHDEKVYTREFKIESGMDRDIEVMAQ